MAFCKVWDVCICAISNPISIIVTAQLNVETSWGARGSVHPYSLTTVTADRLGFLTSCCNSSLNWKIGISHTSTPHPKYPTPILQKLKPPHNQILGVPPPLLRPHVPSLLPCSAHPLPRHLARLAGPLHKRQLLLQRHLHPVQLHRGHGLHEAPPLRHPLPRPPPPPACWGEQPASARLEQSDWSRSLKCRLNLSQVSWAHIKIFLLKTILFPGTGLPSQETSWSTWPSKRLPQHLDRTLLTLAGDF